MSRLFAEMSATGHAVRVSKVSCLREIQQLE
jgi:hypothetical protein